jgi:predicted HTH domain antitoxin
MSVTLNVSDDFARRWESQPEAAEAELHLELAIALYRSGSLPVGRAARIARLGENQFSEILRQRRVPMPYSMNDLEHDIAYASGRR